MTKAEKAKKIPATRPEPSAAKSVSAKSRPSIAFGTCRPSRLERHPLQRQLADEVGQPRNEELVDFQVERRQRELIAIAYEHAALTSPTVILWSQTSVVAPPLCALAS